MKVCCSLKETVRRNGTSSSPLASPWHSSVGDVTVRSLRYWLVLGVIPASRHPNSLEVLMPVALHDLNQEVTTTWWTFPGGERSVRILGKVADCLTIKCDFRRSDDILDILLLNNAVRHIRPNAVIRLLMPYFPYARQDRVMSRGEPFSAQVVGNLLDACHFSSIEVWDCHSDVLFALFSPGTLINIEQSTLHLEALQPYDNLALVSPDAGALKKIYKLAKALETDVVEGGKVRDVLSGEIVKSKVSDFDPEKYSTLVVVDDICDGGRTFIELGKVIRASGFCGRLVLSVTHGIFSQGRAVLYELFDDVLCVNNMENVNV